MRPAGPSAFSRGFSGVTGAVVVGVWPGTPAESAGLVSGDVIVSLDGQSVGTPTELTTMMQALPPGDTIQIGWEDVSGQSQTATVTLATGPAG
jgi:S1-C subfamily serine protease